MGTTAHVRTVHDRSTAVGWSGDRTLTIDRSTEAGGSGLGFSGGELLLLALGACYTNDVYREADALGIQVEDVAVDVACDWGGNPTRARNVTFDVRVTADATEERIQELIRRTDAIAEVHASLRLETPVNLGRVEAAPTR